MKQLPAILFACCALAPFAKKLNILTVVAEGIDYSNLERIDSEKIKKSHIDQMAKDDKESELCEQTQAKYDSWHQQMMQTISDRRDDPLNIVLPEGDPLHARNMKINDYDRRLKGTGLENALSKLQELHPREFA